MLTAEVIDTASRVGKFVARDWPMIDADDITQEVLTGACKRPERYNAMDEAALFAVFRADAHAYCMRERADYTTRTARYLYTPAEVRSLLAVLYETSEADWSKPPAKDSYAVVLETGSIVVSVWDLKEALAQLPTHYRAIIARKHEATGLTREQREALKSAGWEPLTAAERKAYQRAVDRLTERLNKRINRPRGVHENAPGARRAMKNAHAYAVTHDDREGGR
ncbi:hypothetical protein [Nonomuraea rubra]|uniref:hypothetical protein n=1 Tax=Nonomuraea rubra TaxID=46180 RepID=UPI0033C09535